MQLQNTVSLRSTASSSTPIGTVIIRHTQPFDWPDDEEMIAEEMDRGHVVLATDGFKGPKPDLMLSAITTFKTHISRWHYDHMLDRFGLARRWTEYYGTSAERLVLSYDTAVGKPYT